MPETEADTCRRLITPALIQAGWDSETQIAEQRPVAPGRIVVVGRRSGRAPSKRLDYLLRYTRDLPLAVVEAKSSDFQAGEGLQQAIDYAQSLGLPFAYATNGIEIIEHDFTTGREESIERFPSPNELWQRYKLNTAITDAAERIILTPAYDDVSRPARYYQTHSINAAVEALAKGRDRTLLTLATGTGKSYIAFQICWRLWQAHWNRRESAGRPRILYIADRNVLLDQPRLGVFAPFGDALHRIGRDAIQSREIYFATYQQIGDDSDRIGIFRQYQRDFFDLIIVDECHRGSAADNSRWRTILDYFQGAAKLGMTATPLRDESRDTYRYFGNPLVTYTLAQGIEDGFLAPYKVHRVISDIDAGGFRPTQGQLDRRGAEIPDRLYMTSDYERQLVIPERTEAFARYLVDFMATTDPFAKTIVFCVDQEHALNMRNAIARTVPDYIRERPNYVARITSDEGDFGKTHLSQFQDIDSLSPTIVTTSDMLTTGVDAPTVKNIVICRMFTSLAQFKQVIGRGTRLRTDYDKWYFTILDFTGSATIMFSDPDFDGQPAAVAESEIDDAVDEVVQEAEHAEEEQAVNDPAAALQYILDRENASRRTKYYVDNQTVEIVASTVYHLGADGRRLSATSLVEYARDQVLRLAENQEELSTRWANPNIRREIMADLDARGINFEDLAEVTDLKDSDTLDILTHITYGTAVVTRHDRASRVRSDPEFWSGYSAEAREVLEVILDKYEQYGITQVEVPAVLGVSPLAEMGNVLEIAERFGGPLQMKEALDTLQSLLYSSLTV